MSRKVVPVRPHHLTHERILRHLHKIRRAEYVGTIAVEIGYSLGKTESYILFMIDAGELERLDVQDKMKIDARPDAEMIRLVGTFSVAKAYVT